MLKRRLRQIFCFVIDAVVLLVSSALALMLIELDVGYAFKEYWWITIGNVLLLALFFYVFRLYSNLWKYAGLTDAIKLVLAVCCIAIVDLIVSLICQKTDLIRWSVIFAFVFFFFILTLRFGYRLAGYYTNRHLAIKEPKKRIMLIGAGDAGSLLIREMLNSDKINMQPVCLLDDNVEKIGKFVHGIKVAGRSDEVVKYCNLYKVDEIIISMPSAAKRRIGEVILECNKTNCKTKILPGVYQLVNEDVSITNVKEVSVQDLLGRDQIDVNLNEIMGYIEGKVVLVTGGGGSIGSELCRQIATHKPKQLIILDIYENNAYDIQQELLMRHQDLNLLVLIASVRDSRKINNVFEKYKPNIVFHAAAHKHVPLMETSPNEAVKNNVSGTLKVARAADANNVERFVLISTDKAVNPTNIMGATKRICEMIVQTMNKHSKTEYVAVRFGNVLGSNGSVIPLFKKQIEAGGPVTVTDERITRYFMTIPEAVGLVLQAGAYAKGGEIFVLDMGSPMRIYDLAYNLIKLSGFEPNKDIEIKITGLRPGEKLYEERLMDEEGLQRTPNKLISIAKPLNIDEENLFRMLDELYEEAYKETGNMKQIVKELVSTYIIDEKH